MQNPYDRYQNTQNLGAQKTKKKKPVKKSAPRRNSQKVQANKSHLSVGWILSSFVGLALSFYIFNYTDEALHVLNRIQIGFNKSVAAEESADSKTNLPVGMASSINSDSDNLTMKSTNVFKALKDKRRELEKKERRLAQLEEELQKQKAEIEKQLKAMTEMRRNISSKLDKKVTADQESVNKLVGVYSNMKPQNAALVLSSIDDDLAVKILGKMKKQNAAAILNYVNPKKAQFLSEKFTGLKN